MFKEGPGLTSQLWYREWNKYSHANQHAHSTSRR